MASTGSTRAPGHRKIAAAGIARDTILLGMGSYFELWEAQRYAVSEAQVKQTPMPDSLKNLSFA